MTKKHTHNNQSPAWVVTLKQHKHLIFFITVAIIFFIAIIRLFIWNKGISSGYDPNEVTNEFDTEALDYIQPLSPDQLADHVDDGITTILGLGNGPFSNNSNLSDALASTMDAIVYNGGFADSFQSVKNSTYNNTYPNDGISLYHVAKAITSGDYTVLDDAANQLGGNAPATVDLLKSIDYSTLDMITIMYDLSDYIDLRPVMDPNAPNNLMTYTGSLQTAIDMIQDAYPYVRIVVLSTPACGKTIDGFYVDGDIQDLGNGTLVDYLLHEINTCISSGVSIIDNYYGVIHVDNRNEYLENDYFLNEKGAQAIADRVALVLN